MRLMWLMNTCVWQQSANSAHRIIRATVLICNAIHISSALEQRHHTLNVLLINVIVFIESEQMWMSGQKQQVAGSLTSLSSSLTSCLEAHLILATSPISARRCHLSPAQGFRRSLSRQHS